MLGELEDRPERLVVADFEAGIGTLVRSQTGQIDVLVIVVEPYLKSIEVGRRLLELAADLGVPRRLVVANKVRDADDLAVIRTRLGGVEPDAVVPEDASIADADMEAAAPIDHDPHSPGTEALRALALTLAG